MNLETVLLTDENPDPTLSTATEGGNERSVYDDINALLSKFPTGAKVPFQRISKHRGGRIPKLTPEQRAKNLRQKKRQEQLRKTHYLDIQSILGAAKGDDADE